MNYFLRLVWRLNKSQKKSGRIFKFTYFNLKFYYTLIAHHRYQYLTAGVHKGNTSNYINIISQVTSVLFENN